MVDKEQPPGLFDGLSPAWNEMPFPEHYTDTEKRLLARISELEIRHVMLEKEYKWILQMIAEMNEINVDFNDRIKDHSLDISRLDQVYYHVFPERLAQDQKADEQISGLLPKRSTPGADSRKA